MTHINAFYLDVQEKQQAVDTAQGELVAAKVRLENHPDYVAPSKTTVSNKTITTGPTSTFTVPVTKVAKPKKKK